MSESSQSTEYASLGQVLEEAMQEICCLEEKNSHMQEVLSELHAGILGAEDSKTLLAADDLISSTNNKSELEKLRAENKMLVSQLNEFKKLSTSISGKFGTSLNCSNNESCAKDSQNSGLVELKKKLSTSSLILQKLVEKNSLNLTKRKSVSPPSKSSNDHDSINHSSLSFLDQSNTDELQRQLTDALEKNIRWQKYNEEREQYVSLLLSKYNQNSTDLQKTREKLAVVTSNPDKLALEQRRYFDKLLVNARQELESQRGQTLQITTELTILNDKHKEEVHRLETSVERWRKRYEEQREALAALNANYENERRRSNSNAVENKEKQSQIQLLQRQVQLFSEDFRAERKEKEIAQYEINFLKQEVGQLQTEMEKHNKKPRIYVDSVLEPSLFSSNKHVGRQDEKSQDYSYKARQRAASPPKKDSRSQTSDYGKMSDMSPITTRPRTAKPPLKLRFPTSVSEKKHKENKVVVQTTKPNNKSKFLKKNDSSSGSKPPCKRISDTDKLLCCPNCSKQYNIDEHMLLLEHIDVCGD